MKPFLHLIAIICVVFIVVILLYLNLVVWAAREYTYTDGVKEAIKDEYLVWEKKGDAKDGYYAKLISIKENDEMWEKYKGSIYLPADIDSLEIKEFDDAFFSESKKDVIEDGSFGEAVAGGITNQRYMKVGPLKYSTHFYFPQTMKLKHLNLAGNFVEAHLGAIKLAVLKVNAPKLKVLEIEGAGSDTFDKVTAAEGDDAAFGDISIAELIVQDAPNLEELVCPVGVFQLTILKALKNLRILIVKNPDCALKFNKLDTGVFTSVYTPSLERLVLPKYIKEIESIPGTLRELSLPGKLDIFKWRPDIYSSYKLGNYTKYVDYEILWREDKGGLIRIQSKTQIDDWFKNTLPALKQLKINGKLAYNKQK